MSRLRGWHVCFFVAGIAIPPTHIVGGEFTIRQASEANQSAIESMRTFACQITKQTVIAENPNKAISKAHFWCAGDSTRIRTEMGSDSVVRDGIARSLAASRNSDGTSAVRYSIAKAIPSATHGSFDLRSLALFRLIGPDGYPLSLSDLEQESRVAINAVRHMYERDLEYIVADISVAFDSNKTVNWEIWLDPRANYLVSRLHGTWQTDASPELSRRESRVIRFKEVHPTMYFPESVETKFWFFRENRARG
jgi:hypothetical protein